MTIRFQCDTYCLFLRNMQDIMKYFNATNIKKVINKLICSLQDVHNNRETQLRSSSQDRKEEETKFIEADNCLQEIHRESSRDDDYNRGFSLFGLVESMFSVVTNGLNTVVSSIVGTEKKNSISRVRRINYKNHQLIRMFPNTENHVADLRDLKDAEPDDIKFWSFPTPNRCVCYFVRQKDGNYFAYIIFMSALLTKLTY